MKKTINYLFIAAIALTLTFTACSKDETATVSTIPTVTLVDSFGTLTIDTTNFFVFPYMITNAKPAAGTTLKFSKIEIKVNGVAYGNSSFTPLDSDEVNGFSGSVPVSLFTSGLPLSAGKTLTFILTVKDSKDQTASATITYNVINDKAVISSPEIELGAQNNANIPYKFLGLANSFATYTPGANGTARLNSGSIDFVYYYGTNDNNAFAAPANADGAKVIWATEISSWARQNRTKFKATTISATDFDNIKNNSKVDDLFSGIDFTTGTTEKATLLNAGSVTSFQTVDGVKGLAKFTTVGADASGSTKVVLIIQN